MLPAFINHHEQNNQTSDFTTIHNHDAANQPSPLLAPVMTTVLPCISTTSLMSQSTYLASLRLFEYTNSAATEVMAMRVGVTMSDIVDDDDDHIVARGDRRIVI